jgi:beta-lactamase regulating signal transducer with metallopeptidase domain
MIEAIFVASLGQALMLSLAVVVLWLVRPCLLRFGAGLTYAAWWLVPAFLLTPFLPRPSVEPVRLALAGWSGTPATGLAPIPLPPLSSAALWLALWLAGAVVVLVGQSWRQWRLARLGEHLPAGSSPALVGLIRPRVVLPVDFEQRFRPEERALILAHEAVHRQRLDNLWNLCATLLAALHWWNPLAWWAARRLRADQELACDASVLAARPDCGVIYAAALLAAHHLRPPAAPIASRWGSAHPLVERIAMLKHPVKAHRSVVALAGLALVVSTGLAWAGQVATRAGISGPSLKLNLVIAQQVGDRVNSLSLALAGRQGEPMRLDYPGDGSDANPPLALDLTARLVESGKVRIEAVIWEGRPLVVAERASLVLHLNDPGMVEKIEPGTQHRISLVVVPGLAD